MISSSANCGATQDRLSIRRGVAIRRSPWDGIALFAMGMFVRDGYVHLYYRAVGRTRKATIIAYARAGTASNGRSPTWDW